METFIMLADTMSAIDMNMVLLSVFVLLQFLYFCTFMVDLYLFTLPVNMVDMRYAYMKDRGVPEQFPYIVLFYPVLKEAKETMETTFNTLNLLDYPTSRYRIVAIPNMDDAVTIGYLEELQVKFPFLQIMTVPPTTDQRWNAVWANWDNNKHVYWWHKGKRAHNRDLPPKKTRQLIYAFYNIAQQMTEPFLVNYIDADSCPPTDHFMAGAAGIAQGFDVLQAKNVAGNLLENMSTTMHSFDHMAWDGCKYQHLSSNGKNPFWVLGKGLFFKSEDLLEFGGFHPWVTIEDPEVGMRLWKNGKKLGIIDGSLIEEVPNTFKKGVIQRKRWVAGFFQSLNSPLHDMGFTWIERVKAWMIFMPCLSASLNVIGIPIALWAMYNSFYPGDTNIFPHWIIYPCMVNLAMYMISMGGFYWNTWKRTKLVLDSFGKRLYYMLRINPLNMMCWWLFWVVPLFIGYNMYRKDKGLIWERTEKLDKNRELIYTTRLIENHSKVAVVEK